MGFPRVFVTRDIGKRALKLLSQNLKVDLWEGYMPPAKQDLLDRGRECIGLLTLLTDQIDEELIDQLPNLRIISNMATGVDNIDLRAATKKGILVGSTPGILSKTCAEFTMALLLIIARRVVEAEQAIRDGEWITWHPSFLIGQDLNNATLGIVGLGNIGAEVASRARSFGMKVIYFQRHRRPDLEHELGVTYTQRLESLLEESDFVTLHIPLTQETTHLIGEDQLRSMKPTAILINTSRGPIVDQTALASALTNRVISGAALDVFEREPLDPHDPILKVRNLVVTPHIASASRMARDRMAEMAVKNLWAGIFRAPMLHCANPEAEGTEN